MRPKILLLFCCLCICSSLLAQSKKAGKFYGKALKYKAAKKPGKAIKKMAKSINKDPRSPEAYSELGEWYFDAHKFTQAAEVFKNASAHCQNGALRFAKPYARTLIYAGQADKALSVINSLATIRDSVEWNKMRQQAIFVKQYGRPVCQPPVAMSARINSPVPELFPSMAVDTATIYFTRRVNNENDDYFAVSKDTCSEWYNTRNLGYPANSPEQELAQCISPDGHYLFVTRCGNRSEDGFAEGGCDIFMAYRVANDSDWTTPQPFGFTINTPDFEGMPTVSPDTRELYFVSDRKGGYGGYDIYVSRFEEGLWQPPVNLGPAINTAGNETAPYMNMDNKTLFFTSDGHTGFGGTDIFVSQRKTDGSWQVAQNIGYPINTAYDEKSSCMALDGKKLYFASDRNGPAGNYDIFEAYMPYDLRPDPVSYIAGYVYDSLNKSKLTSASIYICTRRDDTLYQFKSNRGDASFIVTLPLNNTYIIHTGYMGHLDVNDTVVFDKQYTQEPMIHNIAMLPSNWEEIRAISDTLIATVHFEANVTELSELDKGILKEALSPWQQHRNYTITVNAYTDNSGNPMLNEELSTRRASIVAKEVADIGIEGIAILSKGWGEINTVATNETEEGRRANRRVEIRIRR
ncbi:MAG: hypothetical protein JWQ38_2512 [Flavipsychrobacter sp.]|nr:hypothetical protein [Flavipsychrobacter sp.]